MLDDEYTRHRLILIRHYFPGVNPNSLSDEEFASLSEEAIWLHKQQLKNQLAGLFS